MVHSIARTYIIDTEQCGRDKIWNAPLGTMNNATHGDTVLIYLQYLRFIIHASARK